LPEKISKWGSVSELHFFVETKTFLFLVSEFGFSSFILELCIQNHCFEKNGCKKLPAFATGNRVLACLGCKELFFLATIFSIKSFDVDANTH